MSRLPRPPTTRNSRKEAGPSLASSSKFGMNSGLKRKASSDDDEEPPRKVAAIAENNQPLRPSRTAPNVAPARVLPVRKATVPKAPTLGSTTTRRVTRSTAGPSVATRPARPTTRAAPARAAPARAAPTRAPPARAAPARTGPVARATTNRVASGSGPSRAGPSTIRGRGAADDQRFKALQDQVTSIESARAADAARLAADMDAERAKLSELQTNHEALSKELAAAKAEELNQRRELVHASDELEQLKRKHANEVMDLEMEMKRKERELREAKEDLQTCRDDLERERETVTTLKATVSHQSTTQLTLTTQVTALQAQICALQAALDQSSYNGTNLSVELDRARRRIAELEDETRKAETLRRKLHNMVQELKGNIRVFCRVRPVLPSDASPQNASHEEEARLVQASKANIEFPDKMDHKEIVLRSSSESATGQERKDEWQFTFDRVFEPQSTQADVFEDISQLAQSCTDGYNVCVFAYGQTGSGKSFTMEGGSTETTIGMIPRAVEQVFAVTDELKNKGWEYKMEGQFLEIYNETINDLLGKGEFDKKKHEIKHDAKTGRTTVTDVNVVPLASPNQVKTLLALAQSRRTVAATLMNERSSRSHSVFTLRIIGENTATGETCEGSLNLVDLAGSERLEKSGAANDKDRLRETQNINRSLSALGDVIAALGEKGEGKSDKHIPYRNSKLTYLLQNSLSGNSKTLMVLNLSPLAVHLNESLCSLRFATKVNNTTIGTAKKQSRTVSS